MFRPLRRSVKGVAFEIHHLLKKVDENFIIALPREREVASLHLTDNAKWVQAQPKIRKFFFSQTREDGGLSTCARA